MHYYSYCGYYSLAPYVCVRVESSGQGRSKIRLYRFQVLCRLLASRFTGPMGISLHHMRCSHGGWVVYKEAQRYSLRAVCRVTCMQDFKGYRSPRWSV